jgi:hypothetical protein
MKFVLLVAFPALFLLVVPSRAQSPCPLTYEFFEAAVPHLDLEACPKELARDNAFCRASVGQDGVHVFVFSKEGDVCLLQTKSYQAGQYEFGVK